MANNLEGWMEEGWEKILNEKNNLKKAIDNLEEKLIKR